MDKLKIAKEVLSKNAKNFNHGIFNTKGSFDDEMICLYSDEELTIEACTDMAYIEVFGLDAKEFLELMDFYRDCLNPI